MKKKIIEIIEDTETGVVEVNSLENTEITNNIMQVLMDNFFVGDEFEIGE